ncbi:MAG TPA: hypothetical protein VNL77_01595 [Roseiflexaceae bacterium]|nr:hypothetical protein [Roseiflexaceae bacterium]
MDNTTEPIRQDIDQIRASMTDKMERIEARIKGTINDTTDSVKRMVDVKHQISDHPWAALGIAVLAGYTLGSLGEREHDPASYGDRSFGGHMMSAHEAYERVRGRPAREHAMSAHEAYERARGHAPPDQRHGQPGYAPSGATSYSGHSQASYAPPGMASYTYTPDPSTHHPSTSSGAWSASMASVPASGSWEATRHSAKPGLMDSLSRQFSDEIEVLKTAAVTSLIGIIRDTIRHNFPSMHHEMERMRGQRGSSPSTSTMGSRGADYARSATSTPPHVTEMHDPGRASGAARR